MVLKPARLLSVWIETLAERDGHCAAAEHLDLAARPECDSGPGPKPKPVAVWHTAHPCAQVRCLIGAVAGHDYRRRQPADAVHQRATLHERGAHHGGARSGGVDG